MSLRETLSNYWYAFQQELFLQAQEFWEEYARVDEECALVRVRTAAKIAPRLCTT